MRGDYYHDFNEADALLGNKWGWTPEQVAAYRTNYDYTWHHHENLRTMQLVPKALNSLPHVGGGSAARAM